MIYLLKYFEKNTNKTNLTLQPVVHSLWLDELTIKNSNGGSLLVIAHLFFLFHCALKTH